MEIKKNRESKEERRFYILTKPILPLLVKISIPTIFGMLVSVLYNLTDTFFVGWLNNRAMIAAVGIVFSFISLMQAIGFWFGYGSGNIMSKKLGEGKEKEAETISSIGILFAILTGIFLAILGRIFLFPLSQWMGGSASEETLSFTVGYLRIIIFTIPWSLYALTLYNQLRLCGNPKDAMIGLLTGMFSNMILDPIFIFSLQMGFLGAGYATLLAQIIACIVLTRLAKKNGNIGVNFKKIKYRKEYSYHILVGGFPNFSRQVITSIAIMLLNMKAAEYGESILAVLTISSKIVALAYMIMIGWGQGFQPICAMNYGAKKYTRVRSAFQWTVLVGTLFLILSAMLLSIFAKECICIISEDEEVLAKGILILRMQCITMPFLAYLAVSSMFMQNIGNYFLSLLISISRQGIFYIPFLYIFPRIYGEFGIYLLQPFADILSFLVTGYIMYSYFWKKGFFKVS